MTGSFSKLCCKSKSGGTRRSPSTATAFDRGAPPVRQWLRRNAISPTATDEGTPQRGPLSPILSNLVLDDLDKELARRGHRFCRYADECNIYVRTGERVMASVSRFLTSKLRLNVNEAKSAVARPRSESFLGPERWVVSSPPST
jgi:hypothetical protein